MQDMNDNELKNNLIREYANIQRIKVAPDKDAEIRYQEAILLTQMQSMGINTEDITLGEKHK